MSNNQGKNFVSGGVKDITRSKSLTPAVLGMPNSHGVKLSLNMTSEDKKELLSQLEVWRKARRERLAASILAKQKQIEKPKTSVLQVSAKNKPVAGADVGNSKIPCRQSVFDRLYKNNGKAKKPEIVCSSKSLLSLKKCTPLPLEGSNKPRKFFLAEKNKIETCHTENANENLPVDSHGAAEKTKRRMVKNDFSRIPVKENNETKPVKGLKCLGTEVTSKTVEPEKQKNPIRRSISMMFRNKRSVDCTVRKSVSAKNLHEMNSEKKVLDHVSSLIVSQPYEDSNKETKNEVVKKSVSLETPKTNPPLTSSDLRAKLESWLKGNGHCLEKCQQLCRFGITSANKNHFFKTPAVFPNNELKNFCYETTPSTPIDDSDKENVTPPTVMRRVTVTDAENWLKELHRLIVELKYPSERCEEWLTAIRNKCSNCSQLPIYWECLAAIHESKGDLKSAIEDYEKAIIKGGEINAVGNSLAQLFDKMVIEQKKSSKRKLEKGLDPKNIFKSTIIKFALQEKASKKQSSEVEPGAEQHLYIATPVRRSTRIQTPLKSSEEVASLQTLTPELLKNVTFQPNESLLHGNWYLPEIS